MMRPRSVWASALLAVAFCAAAATAAERNPCDAESSSVPRDGERQFVAFTGRSGTFYDRSGPAFVMLIKTSPQDVTIGAVGVFAGGSGTPVFGAVPRSTYDEFLKDPESPADVMLRVEITGPQYERELKLLRTWDRRAREQALLYPDIALDNVLLVKQAAEELNRCGSTLALYQLDWGLDDEISENNDPRRIPLEYFRELRRLNDSLHVRDVQMPPDVLVAPTLADGAPVEAELAAAPQADVPATNAEAQLEVAPTPTSTHHGSHHHATGIDDNGER
jgi:hypothetical protein